MEKEFVTYETALALKELGFDEMCLGYYTYDFIGYNPNPYFELGQSPFHMGITPQSVKAPLKQQVFRWFREKYNQHQFIELISKEDFGFTYDYVIYVDKDKEICENFGDGPFNTYEEAENALIDKLIELAKQQDNEK